MAEEKKKKFYLTESETRTLYSDSEKLFNLILSRDVCEPASREVIEVFGASKGRETIAQDVPSNPYTRSKLFMNQNSRVDLIFYSCSSTSKSLLFVKHECKTKFLKLNIFQVFRNKMNIKFLILVPVIRFPVPIIII